MRRLAKVSRFLFSRDTWWSFDKLLELEFEAEINAIFNFHIDLNQRSFSSWIFDPCYDLGDDKHKTLLSTLIRKGHEIGLHPGFGSWQNSEKILEQKVCLEQVTGIKIKTCRQHWLRFSWEDTWFAQQSAGLKCDTTLMFNDRAGFRNSAALKWAPWKMSSRDSGDFRAVPSVFMDSHFYDYGMLDPKSRRAEMRKWIHECYDG